MEQDIIDNYKQRSEQAQQQVEENTRLANSYSMQRLIVFGFFIFFIIMAVAADNVLVFVVGLIISVAWFGWLVKQQNKYEALKQYFIGLKKINDNEAESLSTHANIYYNGSTFANEKHFYTSDLNIFGTGSLFQLINRAATSPGNNKLAAWLNAPADKDVILKRQQAVKEMAAKADWKLDFQTKLLFCLKQPANQVKNLIAYLKTSIDIKDEKILFIYSQISPFLVLALIGLSIFYPAARYITGVVILANYRINASREKLVEQADLIAGKIGEALFMYSFAFECIENEEWLTPYTQQLGGRISRESKNSVSGKIKELSALINKLNNRLNVVVGFILNVLLIWNVRQIIAIERWKRDNHENLEAAFDVLAEFEALVSISSLAINYPDYTFPQIAEGEGYTITANKLAHPLIFSKYRVENDYELQDAFKIDIITGSNMAGKSTFLRTIGINTVLALSGAPVCAEIMTVSVITMVTYMRIKDSLNESTSTFKAELDRLQMLLKAVETEPKVFFLIDEMLRGTNSVDKYLGSKAVIEQLIAKKGVGMVATHDLQIAQLEQKYPDYVRNFYFDIHVIDGEMLFDYKIKDGECKTFNASLLLKQIGIDVGTE